MSDLVAAAAAAGRACDWPTEDWPDGRAPAAASTWRPLLDEVFDDDGPLAQTFAVVVVHRGRMVVERYQGALEHFDRPPTPVTADTPLLSWSMAKSMLHAVVGMLVGDGQARPRRPRRRCPSGPTPATRATPSRCASCWPCATGSTSRRTTSTARSPTRLQMLFGDGQADMAHFAADRPLAGAAGHAVQLLVGHVEHHFGHRGPHRRAGRERTPASCTAGSSGRSA